MSEIQLGRALKGCPRKKKWGRGPPVPPEAHPLSATKGKIVGIRVWFPALFCFGDCSPSPFPYLLQQHTFWNLQAHYMMMTYFFIFSMSIKHISSCKHMYFFFFPTNAECLWSPIYCRVKQPGLDCTLKLLIILMPPNYFPNLPFFLQKGVAQPLFTIFCGRMWRIERTWGAILRVGFRNDLVPSF